MLGHEHGKNVQGAGTSQCYHAVTEAKTGCHRDTQAPQLEGNALFSNSLAEVPRSWVERVTGTYTHQLKRNFGALLGHIIEDFSKHVHHFQRKAQEKQSRSCSNGTEVAAGWGGPGCRALLRRWGPLEGNYCSLETPMNLKDRAAQSTRCTGEDRSPPTSSYLRL